MLGWIRKILSSEEEIKALLTKAEESLSIEEKAKIYGELADEGIKSALEGIAMLAYTNRRWAAMNARPLEVWLRKGTKKDIPWCQLVLGWIYEEGLGVSKDSDEALFRYEQAARMDLPEGFFRLGLMSLRGTLGTRRDPVKAAQYFHQAEQMGHQEAHKYLNTMEGWDLLKREELADNTKEKLLDHDLPMMTPWRQGLHQPPTELEGIHCPIEAEEALYESREELLQKAQSGDPKAICRLGVLNLFGEDDFEQDFSKAAECFSVSARNGVVEAQTNLAALYMTGKGVEQNYKKAKELLLCAASQGDGFAMSKLGEIFVGGIGETLDVSQGIRWYQKAVEQNDIGAILTLGFFYWEGRNIPRNPERAMILFRMAAEQGNPDGINSLARALLDQPEEEKHIEGVHWLKENAKKGDALSMFLLARCYEKGRGVPVDEKEMNTWDLFSARRGFPGAKAELGRQIARGTFSKIPSPTEEMEWLQEAIIKGDLLADVYLANRYLNGGEGFEVNEEKAAELFIRAANQNFPEAQMMLSHLYAEGRGVEQDQEKADFWEKQALDNGDEEAAYLYGLRLYEAGDEENGIRNLTFAADQKYSLAADKLGDIFRDQEKYEKARYWYEQAMENEDLIPEDIQKKIEALP